MEGRIGFLLFLLMIGCGGGKPSSATSKKGKGTIVATNFSPIQPTTTTPIIIKVTAISEKNPEYNWTVNGVSQGINRCKLPPEHFSKGDTIFCSISIQGVEKKKVGPIIIYNEEPGIRSVLITPSGPRKGNDLSIESDVYDFDGDEVELLTDWFINDEKVGTGSVLSGDKFKAGDKVYAEVVPFDGVDKGIKSRTDLIIIQNTPPEIISSLSSITGREMNYQIEVRDVDGDPVSLSLAVAPEGMRLEGDRLLWEAPKIENDTTFSVEFIAKDNRGGETKTSFDLRLSRKEEQ